MMRWLVALLLGGAALCVAVPPAAAQGVDVWGPARTILPAGLDSSPQALLVDAARGDLYVVTSDGQVGPVSDCGAATRRSTITRLAPDGTVLAQHALSVLNTNPRFQPVVLDGDADGAAARVLFLGPADTDGDGTCERYGLVELHGETLEPVAWSDEAALGGVNPAEVQTIAYTEGADAATGADDALALTTLTGPPAQRASNVWVWSGGRPTGAPTWRRELADVAGFPATSTCRRFPGWRIALESAATVVATHAPCTTAGPTTGTGAFVMRIGAAGPPVLLARDSFAGGRELSTILNPVAAAPDGRIYTMHGLPSDDGIRAAGGGFVELAADGRPVRAWGHSAENDDPPGAACRYFGASQSFLPLIAASGGGRVWTLHPMSGGATAHTLTEYGPGNSPTGCLRQPLPDAVLDVSDTRPDPGEAVVFDASRSSDPNDFVASYEWDLDGDGTVDAAGADLVRIERAWDEPGVKGVELRVVDGHGAVGVARADVVVGAPPPAARLTWSPAEPRIGDEVILDASASGGQPVRHEWDLDGDGSFETDGGASPTWALRVLAPTQRVAVRVRTYEGAMDTTAVTIAAAPAAVAPPLERPPGAALPTLDPPAGTAGANVPLAAVDRRGPAMPVTVRRRAGRGGAVRVRLRCPIPEERCAGQVWLQSRRGGRRVTGARAFAGRGGRLFDLRLGLGDAARRRLRNGHTVPAQLVVRARDAAGNARTRRAAVRIAPGPMEDA